MGSLTAGKLQALTKPGRFGDGGGLWLQVRDAKHRSWVFRYTWQGKQRQMGLGGLADVSLAEAREAAQLARRVLRKGRDPLAGRLARKVGLAAQARSFTFRAVALQHLTAHEHTWKNPKHRQQRRNTLDTYVMPAFGNVQAAKITTDDML